MSAGCVAVYALDRRSGALRWKLCPSPQSEIDGDLDGIPDERDRCPSEPEDSKGRDDADGCPMPGVRVSPYLVAPSIEFKLGSDALAANDPRLGALALAITQRYAGLRIEVVGYTERRERDEELARRRAEAVRNALILRGLDPKRVVLPPVRSSGDAGPRSRQVRTFARRM